MTFRPATICKGLAVSYGGSFNDVLFADVGLQLRGGDVCVCVVHDPACRALTVSCHRYRILLAGPSPSCHNWFLQHLRCFLIPGV